MRTVAFLLAIAASGLVLGYKLRDLRRDPRNPFLRSFCLTMALVVLAFTTGLPPVISRIEQATGILAIWTTGVVIAGCASFQATLLLWTHPPDQARLKIYPRLVGYAVVLAVMVALCLVGRIDTSTIDLLRYTDDQREQLAASTPYVGESMLVFVAAFAYTAIEATRHFSRFAKLADRRWLQRGLRLLAIGNFVIFLSCLAMAVVFGGMRFGLTTPLAHRAEALLASAGILLTSVGATIPAWGPRMDRIVAYRRLHPLWLALYQVAPEVVLDPPGSAFTDRWKPWDLNYRLYRRTIEIRDSCLALRPYRDPHVAARAHRLGVHAGLTAGELEATVEAATLAAAVRAKETGQPPTDRPAPDSNAPGGDDLATELSWLTQVARAYARSPIVAATVGSVK